MNYSPKLSVAIPVYNVERYLRECLDSVLGQSLKDIEVVCVDDASTDSTPAILAEYARRDPRVSVITNAVNLKTGSSRNIALGAIRGEYLYCMDGDDLIARPTAFEELLAIADRENLDQLIFDADRFADDGLPSGLNDVAEKILSTRHLDESLCNRVMTGAELMALMKERRCYSCCLWRRIFRSDMIKKNGVRFIDRIIHEDTLFAILAMLASKRAMAAALPYYRRRIRPGSIMTSRENPFYRFESVKASLLKWLSDEVQSKAAEANYTACKATTDSLLSEAGRYFADLPEDEARRALDGFGTSADEQLVAAHLKKYRRFHPSRRHRRGSVAGEPPAKPERRPSLLHVIAGFLPCSRRRALALEEKTRRLKQRVKKLKASAAVMKGDLEEARGKLKKTRLELKEARGEIKELQSGRLALEKNSARLDKSITRLKTAAADERYLANLALPREKLRESTLRWWYYKHPDMPLNLDNPKTFCEKIQLLKLHADTPLMTRLADKYAVREWVAGKIGDGRLIPLLGVWRSAEEVDFDALPRRFVLKANHGSHMMHIVRDKNALDVPAVRAEMSRWLATDYAYMMSPQLQYANIPRRIIAEEYLENADGELHDWKVWCYRGRAHYIEYMSRLSKRLRFVFLDREWNVAPFSYKLPGMEKIDPPPRKPGNLDELLRLAETLAEGFQFVRVDFYRLDDGSYKFGEMTFSPSGGNAAFEPPEWNEKIGALFDCPPGNLMN